MSVTLRPLSVLLTAAALATGAVSLSAQNDPDDIYWDQRFPAIGINGTVQAVAVQGNDVFLAGNFTEAGGLVVRNVARWNNVTFAWSQLGTGVRGQVLAVAAMGRYVYVGGRFDEAGGVAVRNLAAFDLQTGQWSALLDAGSNGVDATVRVLTADNGLLYVGGDFQSAGSVASPCLARYNPATGSWDRMINSITSLSVADPSVSAIAFNGADMYVGGEFDRIDGVNGTNVIRKTASGWESLGPAGGAPSGVDGRVTCFAFRNDSNQVYMAGEFKQASRQGTNVFLTSNICYWRPTDRSFQPLMPNGTNTNYNPRGTIMAMRIWKGYLYAGGIFTDAGGLETGGFARYDFSGQRQAFNPVGNGVEGSVFALADLGDALLLAGNFPRAGGVAASGAALWTDLVYTPLTDVPDNGTNGPVSATLGVGADLYVAGTFTVAGGRAARNIARWDGSRWSSLASGLNGPVYAMTVVGTDLYVGGSFSMAGTVPVRNIARYSTVSGTWSAVGTGLPGSVLALTHISGTVYAGGGFNDASLKYMAVWGGSSWAPVGTGVSDTVRCLAASGGVVFAGGDFTQAGSVPAQRTARWDGTQWLAMGTGLTGGISNSPRAYAMAVDGSDVIVGGDFASAGDIATPYVARWNRTLNAWGALGPGAGTGPCDVVYAVAAQAGHVYVGGRFLQAGAASVNYVVDYDGSRFVPLGGDAENGVNDIVYSLTVWDGRVCAGGYFTATADGFANRIAAYGGGAWTALGGTITAGLSRWVRALAIDGDHVYAGGEFTATGTSEANRIIRWNNVLGAWSTLGPGLDGPVYALAIDGDRLYVGGSFATAGGLPARNIAVWDISRRRWENLGDVENNGVDGAVRAIAIDRERIYVGGDFTSAMDSATFNRIAAWDRNGRRWIRLSNGADSTVLAIGIAGENVYVGGAFFRMDGLPASHIARWETRRNRWERLGAGTNGAVRAIATDGPNVYIGGDFVNAGTISAPHVVRWDNNTDFFDFVGNAGVGGGDVEARVHALAVNAGILFVAGEFTRIDQDSGYNNLARWNRSTRTWKKFGSGITGAGTVPVVSTVAVNDAHLFAGGNFDRAGGHGSYYFAHWEGQMTRPADASLDAAFGTSIGIPQPNPCITLTYLPLVLDRDAEVSVDVVDALGRVTSMAQPTHLDAGTHHLPCDVRHLPAGTYVARVRVGQRLVGRTIVVTR